MARDAFMASAPSSTTSPGSASRRDGRLGAVLASVNDLARSLHGTNEFLSPTAWRARSAGFGLPALDLPASVGGKEFSASEMVQIFEYMGRFSLDMRDMVGGGHGRPLARSDRPEHRAIASRVARGEAYVAIAITEEGAGSDVRGMASTSKRVEGGYELSGAKMFNARLEDASHVVIFARAEAETGRRPKLNAFVVPIDHPGLDITSIRAHGLRGNSFGGVSFDKMTVPASALIGGEGQGGKVFHEHFQYWRLMQSAAAIGTAKGALEQAAQQMRSRAAFGRPLGAFTHLQQELAEHTAKLTAASLLAKDAAAAIDAGDEETAAMRVPMLKAEGLVWAEDAADFAMRVFGARGYSPDSTDLGQRVFDLKGLRIADGATDVMRSEVVRRVWGDDFWQMATGELEPAGPVRAAAANDARSPKRVFEQLRNQRTANPKVLLRQSAYEKLVLPEGGGPCPTVCGANFVQCLAAIADLGSPIDLDRLVRDAYRSKPALSKGRLSNQHVADVLEFYRSTAAPALRLSSRVDTQVGLSHGPNPPGTVEWHDLDGELLRVEPGELKMISFTVESAGGVLGRHFVILKDRIERPDGGVELRVVDPVAPMKDHSFRLVRVRDPGASSSRLVLDGPVMNGGTRNVINSVFTARVDDRAA